MVDKINQQEIEIYDGIGAGYLFFVLFLYLFFFFYDREAGDKITNTGKLVDLVMER